MNQFFLPVSNQQAKRDAERLASANLKTLADEVVRARRGKFLSDDARLREVAQLLEPVYGDDAFRQAEDVVIKLCLAAVAAQ